ncbi:MAG: carboxylating nicotinate-nucleotide diphosphorylase [Oscillospiraceae bacterium]|nr:carboxylating nicotinate-nucleotide diphosphorylase [Oscillospiraceae bacterium]
MKLNDLALDAFLQAALEEDIGAGDVTTESCVPATARSCAVFIAKESGVVCGLEVAGRVFRLLDADVRFTPMLEDGEAVSAGAAIAEIEGPSRSILTGERTALNLLQHMSGVATRTAAAVSAVAGTSAKITDTRKITPGLRALLKYAVRCGGGSNHRMGLSDGVLIKDNHIKAAGGIRSAVEAARAACPHTLKIEVETETLEQVQEALECSADIIMLDNMTLDLMGQAVTLIGGRALTEASGNMGDKDLKAVADTGVDYISIGALTHTVRALDISLKFR